MNASVIVGVINLLCVGIFAGEEFTIRYGVRSSIASLDDRPHIQVRQALIRRLRILVPSIFILTMLSGIAATIVNGFDNGFGFRLAGLIALITFITITMAGTAPINQAAVAWDSAAPPNNWRTLIRRWEQLDTWRCWAVIVAFVLFLMALVLR